MAIRAAQIVPAAVTAAAAVTFWRPTLDVFNTTKATVVVVGALVLGAALGIGLVRRRTVTVPVGPWAWALGAFAVALVVATLVSPTPLRSAVGVTGRHGGLIPYLASGVLAVAFGTAAARDAEGARHVLVRWSGGAGVLAGGYVLVQAAGADPLPWTTVEGGAPHFGPFGNVDFASAWLGIVGVLLAGAAMPIRAGSSSAAGTSLGRLEQGLLAATAAVCAAAAILTGSLQGPVVLAVGLPAVLIAGARPARRTLLLTGGVVLVVAAGLAAGPAGGVLASAQRSVETRTPKWEAALAMTAAQPLVGRGLDTYGDHWFAARSPDLAVEEGLTRSVDNAHAVPLHLLTGGGIALAGSWLALVAVIPAWGLWRRRRAWTTDPAAVGLVGAWAGYLLQATVSIDVPPLMVLGLVLTAAVAAQGQVLRARDEVPVAGAAPVGVALAAIAMVAILPATRALRADAAGWDADVARARAAPLPAESATLHAMRLAPWESRYPAMHGAWLTAAGQTRAAVDWQVEALRREPRSLAHALNVARLLAALGDDAGAAQAYDRVLLIDPLTPAVVQEARAGAPGAAERVEGSDGAISPPR